MSSIFQPRFLSYNSNIGMSFVCSFFPVACPWIDFASSTVPHSTWLRVSCSW